MNYLPKKLSEFTKRYLSNYNGENAHAMHVLSLMDLRFALIKVFEELESIMLNSLFMRLGVIAIQSDCMEILNDSFAQAI